MLSDFLYCHRRTQVDVGGFPSHRKEQAAFVAIPGQDGELDSRAVRREPAQNPMSVKVNEGVDTTDGPIDDELIQNFIQPRLRVGPMNGGRGEQLCFAGNLSPAIIRDGDKAQMAETSQAGDTANEPIFQSGMRQKMLESRNHSGGYLTPCRNECIDLFPEMDRIAQLGERNRAQPAVALFQNEGPAVFRQRLGISVENFRAGVLGLDGQVPCRDREQRADREPYEIIGVREGAGLVEIVNTPDKAAFGVSPGAEVFDVEVANREDPGRFRKRGAYIGPDLKPTVKGRSQKGENGECHLLMFQSKIGLDEGRAGGQPTLVASCSFDDIHANNYAR